jgi:hypothetical protein
VQGVPASAMDSRNIGFAYRRRLPLPRLAGSPMATMNFRITPYFRMAHSFAAILLVVDSLRRILAYAAFVIGAP